MYNPKFLDIAIKESYKAYKKNDVPVGCVIVYGDKIISKSYNKKYNTKQITDHAELIAIKKAINKNKDWRLNNCEMYVTLEPCLMCAGAILQTRIKTLYIATKDPTHGAFSTSIDITKHYKFNKDLKIIYIDDNQECLQLIKKFFKEKRKNN